MNLIKKHIRKLDKGFSLPELVVVIVVIGIMATIVLVNYGNWHRDIIISTIKNDLNGIVSAMEDYRNFNDVYSSTVPTNFKPSKGVTLNGGSINSGKAFCIEATSEGLSYSVSQQKMIFPGVCPVLFFDLYAKSSYAVSGNKLNDLSGYNVHGAMVGGATFDSQAKGSLRFDGVDDWIDGVVQPNTKNSPNEFTVMGVIKPDEQNSFIVVPDSNGQDQSIYFNSTSGRLSINVAEAQNLNRRTRSTSANAIAEGDWTHWAISVNDKNIKMYINGELNAEYNETINIADWSGNWTIGRRGGSYTDQYYYKGLMGMLGVYGRALSSSEVKSNFESSRFRYGL